MAAALAATGCSPRRTPGAVVPGDGELPNVEELAEGEVLVALFTSRSGPLAGVDRGMIAGAWLARAEINAAGGVLGARLGIVVEDDHSSAYEAEHAFERLVADARIVATVGPTTASAMREVTGHPRGGSPPIGTALLPCESAPMAVVSASAENYGDPCVAGAPAAFGGFDESSIAHISDYVAAHVRGDTAAYLRVQPDGAWFEQGLLRWSRADAVVARERYTVADAEADFAELDLSEMVAATVAERPAVIALMTYLSDGARITAELQQHLSADYRPQLIGWRYQMSDAFVAAAPPEVVEGMIGFAERRPDDHPAYAAFAAAYRAAFDAPPPVFSAGVYDAVYALALALERAGRATRDGALESLRLVANPPGEAITPGRWADGVAALRAGREIDYDGASGAKNWDDRGQSYGPEPLVWTVRAGRIEVLGQLPLP